MTSHLASDLASLRIDRTPRAPRRWPAMLAGALAVTAAGGLALVKGRAYVESRLFKLEVSVTEITSVAPAQGDVELTATGYVIAQSTAKLAAKIVGRISKSGVREGGSVKAGEVVFELDVEDQAAAVAAARARQAAAGARIATSLASRVEFTVEHEREQKLLAAGAAARSGVEVLEARLKVLTAQIAAARAEANAAAAEVTSLTTGLKNLRILAPIDGTAVSKPASVGDVASPGVALVELADFASLLVEVDVPEARLGRVKPGAPCTISLDAFGSERFLGEVAELGPRLNRAKATGIVKVKFTAPPASLRPEMSARVSFLDKALDEAQLKEPDKVVVPRTALVEQAGGKAVFVLENGKVRLTPVVVGAPLGQGFVLESGPPPKTRVVREPPKDLTDGQAVSEKTAS
ncbi:MAG: efflux RND transporter periplasmic adaptor subunit [Myxococcales bacterium]|nr:efflux RND transporter periplasmic adaptor subunit [Myxococcales bacterium]